MGDFPAFNSVDCLEGCYGTLLFLEKDPRMAAVLNRSPVRSKSDPSEVRYLQDAYRIAIYEHTHTRSSSAFLMFTPAKRRGHMYSKLACMTDPELNLEWFMHGYFAHGCIGAE